MAGWMERSFSTQVRSGQCTAEHLHRLPSPFTHHPSPITLQYLGQSPLSEVEVTAMAGRISEQTHFKLERVLQSKQIQHWRQVLVYMHYLKSGQIQESHSFRCNERAFVSSISLVGARVGLGHNS